MLRSSNSLKKGDDPRHDGAIMSALPITAHASADPAAVTQSSSANHSVISGISARKLTAKRDERGSATAASPLLHLTADLYDHADMDSLDMSFRTSSDDPEAAVTTCCTQLLLPLLLSTLLCSTLLLVVYLYAFSSTGHHSRYWFGFTFAVTCIVFINCFIGLALEIGKRIDAASQRQRQAHAATIAAQMLQASGRHVRGVGKKKKKQVQENATDELQGSENMDHPPAAVTNSLSHSSAARSSCCAVLSRYLVSMHHSTRWNSGHAFLTLLSCSFLCAALFLSIMDSQALPTSSPSYPVANWLRVVALALTCIMTVMEGGVLASRVALTWTPVHRFARSALICISALQLAVSMSLVVLNLQVATRANYAVTCLPLYLMHVHEWFGVFGVLFACHTLNLVAMLRGNDRLKISSTNLLFFSGVLALVGAVGMTLYEIIFIIRYALCDIQQIVGDQVALAESRNESAEQIARLQALPGVLDDLRTANIILVSLHVCLYVVATSLAHRLPAPAPSRLATEEVHIASLTSERRSALCASIQSGIDAQGTRGNLMTADAAIELMEVYQAGNLKHVRGIALRIFRPAAGGTQQHVQQHRLPVLSAAASVSAGTVAVSPAIDPSAALPSIASPSVHLVEPAIAVTGDVTASPFAALAPGPVTGLSKNEARKQAKKAQAKAARAAAKLAAQGGGTAASAAGAEEGLPEVEDVVEVEAKVREAAPMIDISPSPPGDQGATGAATPNFAAEKQQQQPVGAKGTNHPAAASAIRIDIRTDPVSDSGNRIPASAIQDVTSSSSTLRHRSSGAPVDLSRAQLPAGPSMSLGSSSRAAPVPPPASASCSAGRPTKLPSEQTDLFFAFVTVIDEYDMSTQVGGLPGRILSALFGSNSCLPWRWAKPTVLRLGLVGFQWPFKQGLFPMHTPHQRSRPGDTHVHRSSMWSAALTAIVEWNEAQPRHRRCDILLLPAQTNETILCRAITGGTSPFFPIHMPPTHVLDLRPYNGCTLNEFLSRAARKGSRKDMTVQFRQRGGLSQFTHEVSQRYADQMARNSTATATIRIARAEPSMLCTPTPAFMASLSRIMSQTYFNALLLHRKAESEINEQQGDEERGTGRVQIDPPGMSVAVPSPHSIQLTSDAVGSRDRTTRLVDSAAVPLHVGNVARYMSGDSSPALSNRVISSAASTGIAPASAAESMSAYDEHFGSELSTSSLADLDVIASCVVFEFPGSLMTSDIHGQLHERSRSVKAYFAMLHLVVERALARGVPFIDFGPTTSGPKLDLGCRSVPMRGAAYCRNLVLAAIMRTAAKAIVEVHTSSAQSTNSQ